MQWLLTLVITLSGCSLGADLDSVPSLASDAATDDSGPDKDVGGPPADVRDEPQPDLPPDLESDPADPPGCLTDGDCGSLDGADVACRGGECEYECAPSFRDVNMDLNEADTDGCECEIVAREVCGNAVDDDCNGEVDENCCQPGRWTPLPRDTRLIEPIRPSVAMRPSGEVIVAWLGTQREQPGGTTVRVVVLGPDLSVEGTYTYPMDGKLGQPRAAITPTGFLLAMPSSTLNAVVWDEIGLDGQPLQPLFTAASASSSATLPFDIVWSRGRPVIAFASVDPELCGDVSQCLAVASPGEQVQHIEMDYPDEFSVGEVHTAAKGDVFALTAYIKEEAQGFALWALMEGDEYQTGKLPVAPDGGNGATVSLTMSGDTPMMARVLGLRSVGIDLLGVEDDPSHTIISGTGMIDRVQLFVVDTGVGLIRREGLAHVHTVIDPQQLTVQDYNFAATVGSDNFAVAGGVGWGGFVVVAIDGEMVSLRAHTFDGEGTCPPSLD